MERFLSNKVCIITGAAQGIGKSIVERFAADGAIVYACDRTEGSMDEWVKDCMVRNGVRVFPLYFDVMPRQLNSLLCLFLNKKVGLMYW